jgi:hypothetical protein
MSVPPGYSPTPQTTMSPMHEFPQFDYHNTTPMPMEPAAYAIPRPGPFASSHAQMPPPLIMPHSGLWPSMLASQPQPTYQTPILPAGPLQTPLSASTASEITPTSAKTSTARRKLTDDERRQMCIEAEQNPTMKQTQIGGKQLLLYAHRLLTACSKIQCGKEVCRCGRCRAGPVKLISNSTVSKILRQRDKYMNPQPKEESSSPGKKSKAKLPDFEKTLTNWVKNQQRKGSPITDEDLRKQAQVFSFSRSDQAVVSSTAWLEKFKRRNRLVAPGHDADPSLESSATSLSQTPLDGSPASSDGLVSPSMSAIDEQAGDSGIKIESNQDFFAFGEGKGAFAGSSVIDEELDSQLEHPALDAIMSPTSPDRGDPQEIELLGDMDGASGNSSRQRSQTYSHASSHASTSRPSSSGQSRHALPVRSLTTTGETRPMAIDPRQMVKRHKSVPDIHYPDQVRFSSMQPPPLPRSADTSPINGPASPVEDENIRALHAIKALLEQNPAVAEPDDYMAIGKLMEKLKALRTAAPPMPGGMHPIDVVESPRISKKRTILGIST